MPCIVIGCLNKLIEIIKGIDLKINKNMLKLVFCQHVFLLKLKPFCKLVEINKKYIMQYFICVLNNVYSSFCKHYIKIYGSKFDKIKRSQNS